jgi:hypothetical protein
VLRCVPRLLFFSLSSSNIHLHILLCGDDILKMIPSLRLVIVRLESGSPYPSARQVLGALNRALTYHDSLCALHIEGRFSQKVCCSYILPVIARKLQSTFNKSTIQELGKKRYIGLVLPLGAYINIETNKTASIPSFQSLEPANSGTAST